jgi:hypothetical protein
MLYLRTSSDEVIGLKIDQTALSYFTKPLKDLIIETPLIYYETKSEKFRMHSLRKLDE